LLKKKSKKVIIISTEDCFPSRRNWFSWNMTKHKVKELFKSSQTEKELERMMDHEDSIFGVDTSIIRILNNIKNNTKATLIFISGWYEKYYNSETSLKSLLKDRGLEDKEAIVFPKDTSLFVIDYAKTLAEDSNIIYLGSDNLFKGKCNCIEVTHGLNENIKIQVINKLISPVVPKIQILNFDDDDDSNDKRIYFCEFARKIALNPVLYEQYKSGIKSREELTWGFYDNYGATSTRKGKQRIGKKVEEDRIDKLKRLYLEGQC